ncbi:MAG: hypothetical protein ACU841_11155 [Gammaproteobacteria bacterium]
MTYFTVFTKILPVALFVWFCGSAMAAADGRLILSWVESDGQSSTVRFAVREPQGWSSVRTVTQVEGKLGDPAVDVSASAAAVV